MISLKYYADLLLTKEESDLLLKYNSKKKFESLSKAQWYFINLDDSKLSWIKNKAIVPELLRLSKLFSERLNDQFMSFSDKVELVLAHTDIYSSTYSFLEAKGARSVTCICPKCGGYGDGSSKGRGKQERAWVPNSGTAKAVKCNHRSSCGFYGDLIAVYAEKYGLKYGQALNILADEFNIDFTVDEVHIEGTKEIAQKPKIVLEEKVFVPKEVEYISFDGTRPYVKITDIENFMEKYPSMTEEQQFKMIATSIYRFSLTTKQWGKDKYFKSIGIERKNKLLTEKIAMIDSYLGFLFVTDIPEMMKHLQKLFPKEDLIKYGVMHDENHYFANQFKVGVEDGLVVVPNFDLYTNMCTGLKFRKTKLRTRTDKKTNEIIVDSIKEPEFSYGRIANPLPYHLTRVAMLDKSISFRFFEGQKDLHSMPSKRGVCDIAIPGVNGIKEEMLGLFTGRNVELYFDQDSAGQEGAEKLKELLEKAGVNVTAKAWDSSLGVDVNDVLRNGNIQSIR